MKTPATSGRRLLATAATIAACSGVAATAATSASASSPKCASSGLVVWLNTQSNGAAGTIYYTLEMTNLSGGTCTLSGYPGVSAVDLSGHQLGRSADRNPAHATKTVTLANGATATATLGITDTGVYSPSTCGIVTAAGLRVYPPNQTGSKVVPYPFPACSHSGPVYLHVQSVQKS